MSECNWGTWVEDWPRGRFTCTFHEALPGRGWIEAEGLYRAQDGDTLTDLDTYQAEIAARTQVVAASGGTIRVRAGYVAEASVLALVGDVALSELAAQMAMEAVAVGSD